MEGPKVSLTHAGLCELCGERATVQARLVAWRVPVFGPYDSVDACVDVEACRARIEARGDEWPIREPVR